MLGSWVRTPSGLQQKERSKTGESLLSESFASLFLMLSFPWKGKGSKNSAPSGLQLPVEGPGSMKSAPSGQIPIAPPHCFPSSGILYVNYHSQAYVLGVPSKISA